MKYLYLVLAFWTIVSSISFAQPNSEDDGAKAEKGNLTVESIRNKKLDQYLNYESPVKELKRVSSNFLPEANAKGSNLPNQKTQHSEQNFNKMPVYQPEGHCPMPVMVPDSTVQHTLLIKKVSTY